MLRSNRCIVIVFGSFGRAIPTHRPGTITARRAASLVKAEGGLGRNRCPHQRERDGEEGQEVATKQDQGCGENTKTTTKKTTPNHQTYQQEALRPKAQRAGTTNEQAPRIARIGYRKIKGRQ